MREQPGVPRNFVQRAHRADVQTAQRNRVSPTNRQPIYDDEYDDDAIYTTRLPNSTRRYAAPTTTPSPHTVMRVTTHKGPPPVQRTSRTQAPYQEPDLVYAPPEKRRVHGLVYVGIGMVCMVVGWWALSSLAQWWQFQQNNWHYGTPRTFQVDADVRHGGMSHFTVENLNGHILIYEVQLSDMSKPHLYLGPVFSGAGSEFQPATISFEDINGDSYPDMVIAVGTGRYPLINDHSAFRQVNSSDHLISGKGV
jgi:hypothetical protein